MNNLLVKFTAFSKCPYQVKYKILRNFCNVKTCSEKQECKVLIVGGGSGGCAVAAKCTRKLDKKQVIIIEPNDKHYYQPMFTLIGGGMKRLEHSHKSMANVLPKDAIWLQEKAVQFDPQNNTVITSGGKTVTYDLLLIAMGLQLNYNKIPGLLEALSMANSNVCSIYSPKYVEATFKCIQQIENGNAVFTFPATPVKCPGAPQKIMYIAEHYFRKKNKRNKINITYNTSLPVLFGVKHYADALWPIVKMRNINVNLRTNLMEIKPQLKKAVFQNLDTQEISEIEYSMLHAVPPMSPPSELIACKELVNEQGFVDVNNSTMQSRKYKNIFAIGDSSGSSNSKTAASAAAQSAIVFNNMMAVLEGKEPKGTYDGYASCPLVTGYNSCILAEFDYNLNPLETFPISQNKERYSMFLLKKYFMPFLYWNLMLTGYWNGPAMMRNILSAFKFK